MILFKKINIYFKITIKEFLFLVLLFLLLYIEPITIGQFKISQIWKTIVVVVLFLQIIYKQIRFPTFIWIGILYSIKFLIYYTLPYGILRAVQDTLEAIIFPLFLAVFYIKYRDRADFSKSLINIAVLLSLFIIYSSVPFLFNFKGLNPETELTKYGLESNAVKGLFYHIAVSSKLYTIATIVIINLYSLFSKSLIQKLFWLTTVIIGSYFVYASWTRTGWAVFIIALIVSVFYKVSFKKQFIGIIFIFIMFLGLATIYQNNEAVQMRITGGAKYRTNTELTYEQISQGRIPILKVGIDNFIEQNLFSQLIGYGTIKGMDLFKIKTGMEINSHNRTIEIMESSGIIGLILYLLFIVPLFQKLISKRNRIPIELKKLNLIAIILFLGFYLTSHGTPIFGEIIYACIFTAILIENSRLNKYEKK